VNRKRDLLLVLIGLSLLAFAVARVGIHNLLRQTNVLRIGLPIVIAMSFARLVFQTVAWRIALRHEGIEASIAELMLIRLASQGMGYLTILGPAASEPMKISLLRGHPSSATTATLVDTGVYWIASSLVGIAGCIAAGVVFVRHQNSILPMLVLGLFLCAALILTTCKNSPLVPLTRALGIRCPNWLEKAARIDARLREFGSRHPRAVQKMFVLDFFCQVLVAGEVAAVFWSLELPLHLGTLLGLEAATRMVKIAAGFMPARIGADETGAAAAFVAFGLSAASGVAMALARRVRDLLACSIGLIWLASKQRFTEMEPDPTTVSA
jgi:uncharacterized membrane protein YbhN (UPF0104 family)